MPLTTPVMLLGGFCLGVISAGCPGAPEAPVKSVRPRPRVRTNPRPPLIWLDGKRIHPRVVWLSGDPWDASLGGMAKVDGTPVYVEAGQQLRLIVGGPNRRCFHRLGPRGKRTLIGVEITADCPADEDKNCVVHNPLANLSRAQTRRLRSVTLKYWNAEILQQLQRTDARRLCLSVEAPWLRDRPLTSPRLPSISCLEIGNSGLGDYSALALQSNLRYFKARVMARKKMPLGSLRQMTRLRVLDLSWARVSGTSDVLAKLTQLRDVNLSGLHLKQVRFVRQLRSLRVLNLSFNNVNDLTPLGGHPTLERCNASATIATRLPVVRLPRLRELNLLSTWGTRSELERFRNRHPGVRVWRSFRQVLLHAIVGVTRLRIVRLTSDSSKVLAEEREQSSIRRFVRNLRFTETGVGKNCCEGFLRLQFYRGSRLVVTLRVGDTEYVRWQKWPTDAQLDASSKHMLQRIIQRGRLVE